MALLNFLAAAFIGFFGITPPSEKQKRLVNLVLGGFLLGVILFVIALGICFFAVPHSSR
jgi:hypothetical protein